MDMETFTIGLLFASSFYLFFITFMVTTYTGWAVILYKHVPFTLGLCGIICATYLMGWILV